MTEIHPTASLNWVRLLTMSKHQNPIQTDRFRRNVTTQYSTPYKQMKEPQELTRNSCWQTNQNKETNRETAPRSGVTKKIFYPISTCNPILRQTLIVQSMRTNPRTKLPQFLTLFLDKEVTTYPKFHCPSTLYGPWNARTTNLEID